VADKTAGFPLSPELFFGKRQYVRGHFGIDLFENLPKPFLAALDRRHYHQQIQVAPSPDIFGNLGSENDDLERAHPLEPLHHLSQGQVELLFPAYFQCVKFLRRKRHGVSPGRTGTIVHFTTLPPAPTSSPPPVFSAIRCFRRTYFHVSLLPDEMKSANSIDQIQILRPGRKIPAYLGTIGINTAPGPVFRIPLEMLAVGTDYPDEFPDILIIRELARRDFISGAASAALPAISPPFPGNFQRRSRFGSKNSNPP